MASGHQLMKLKKCAQVDNLKRTVMLSLKYWTYLTVTNSCKSCRKGYICMMALFHYQDQDAVSGFCCQDSFSNILFNPKREDKFEYKGILTKHFCLGSKITLSCKGRIIWLTFKILTFLYSVTWKPFFMNQKFRTLPINVYIEFLFLGCSVESN